MLTFVTFCILRFVGLKNTHIHTIRQQQTIYVADAQKELSELTCVTRSKWVKPPYGTGRRKPLLGQHKHSAMHTHTHTVISHPPDVCAVML